MTSFALLLARSWRTLLHTQQRHECLEQELISYYYYYYYYYLIVTRQHKIKYGTIKTLKQ